MSSSFCAYWKRAKTKAKKEDCSQEEKEQGY